MKPKVLITRMLPDSAVSLLEERCEITMWPHENDPVSRTFLQERISEAEGLYCLLTDAIDEALLDSAPKLKIISTMAVGYNHIDVRAATRRGIMVTNTPGVLTETTADLTFALMLAAARRLVEASDFVRQGEWKTWSPMLLTGQDVYGATLGIIGMGRIGEAVARRASGFAMNVLYYNRSRKAEIETQYGVKYAELDDLLKASDFVVILTPYTPETVNLITMKQLRLMKRTAVLINCARGGIVNENDLFDALQQGLIWGAGLDVFEMEPVSADHPLLSLPNVVVLPHIGSASIGTRTRMAELAAINLLQGLTGEKPPSLVNPEVMGR